MVQSSELRDVMLSFYDALGKGDLSYFDRHFSTSGDVRAIGTDPAEWWRGGAAVAEIWRGQIEALGGSMNIAPGDVEAFTEGSVGWVADQATFSLDDGSKLPIRFTAVFHQEDGDWKLVQSHGSIGVSNEESIGEDLPT
jgi:ketosteroid isomerase-like protein